MPHLFDIMAAADKAEAQPDKAELHTSLCSRQFNLYYPRGDTEVDFYVADAALRDAINVAISTGRPLLLTGEPGTGKSSAATWIAGRLGLDLLRFQVKSTTRAQDLLYDFNAIDYFRAAQIAATTHSEAPEKGQFVTEGALWKALKAVDRPAVLLIDEVDKAPRDFPNDLLFEIDNMEFRCSERGDELIGTSRPELRPIVVITSNSERRLPEPFLRRCVFHHIELDEAAFKRILDRRLAITVAFFTAPAVFREAAETCFFQLRDHPALQKKPSIGEFWQWFTLAAAEEASRKAVLDVAGKTASLDALPHLSALVKSVDDRGRLAQR